MWFQQPGSHAKQCSVLCKGRSQSLASLSPLCWAGAPTKPDAGVPRSHANIGSPPKMAAFLARAANRKEKLTALLIMPLQKESEPDKWDRKDDPDPLTGQFCRKFSTVSSNRQYWPSSTCHLSRQGSAQLTPRSNLRQHRLPQQGHCIKQLSDSFLQWCLKHSLGLMKSLRTAMTRLFSHTGYSP